MAFLSFLCEVNVACLIFCCKPVQCFASIIMVPDRNVKLAEKASSENHRRLPNTLNGLMSVQQWHSRLDLMSAAS